MSTSASPGSTWSIYSFGDWVTHVGFGALAVLLLWTTLEAVRVE